MDVKFVPVSRRHLKRLNQIVNDPDVARFITLTPPCPMKSTIEFYNFCRKMSHLWWAIIYNGEVVGSVSLMRMGKARQKKMGHVVTLGITIDRPYWKMGLGKKAIKYAKRQARLKGFKRLDLLAVKTNRRAVTLYKHCGFKKEGLMKKLFFIDGGYYDAIMMSQWLG